LTTPATQRGRQIAFSLIAGLIFGAGLTISGMTQPDKVLAFLDVTGAWDPSLAFVMGGALALHALLYPLVRKRAHPIAAISFQVPQRSDITGRLVAGAALFGIGWGIGGFCPGPALTSIGPGLVNLTSVLVFIPMMILGMVGFNNLDAALSANRP
jgi:hypothetical protein